MGDGDRQQQASPRFSLAHSFDRRGGLIGRCRLAPRVWRPAQDRRHGDSSPGSAAHTPGVTRMDRTEAHRS